VSLIAYILKFNGQLGTSLKKSKTKDQTEKRYVKARVGIDQIRRGGIKEIGSLLIN
jgi:hypothetical protein